MNPCLIWHGGTCHECIQTHTSHTKTAIQCPVYSWYYASRSSGGLGTACAPHTHEIKSAEVSPEQYKELSCAEVHTEMNTHLIQLAEVGREVDEAAEKDETHTTVGVILLWPVLFWLEGSVIPLRRKSTHRSGVSCSRWSTLPFLTIVQRQRPWPRNGVKMRKRFALPCKKKKERQSQLEYEED